MSRPLAVLILTAAVGCSSAPPPPKTDPDTAKKIKAESKAASAAEIKLKK
jgi:hypothetical protein